MVYFPTALEFVSKKSPHHIISALDIICYHLIFLILTSYVQFFPDILSLFLSLYRKSWMNRISAILCLLYEYLGTGFGAWGWFSFAKWLTAKSCFAAPWRVHFIWHLIRLVIFPCQSLRIELIILNEYWFIKIKLALGLRLS